MNRTTTIVLAVLLVLGLGVMILFKEKPADVPVREKLFPGFDLADVSALSFAAGERTTRVRRAADGFEVLIAEQWIPAERAEVEEALGELGRTNVESRIPGEGKDLTQYGLVPGVARLTVVIGGTERAVVFGNPGSARDTIFAQRQGEADVLAIGDLAYETLAGLKAEDLMDKQILDFTGGDVARVVIEKGDEVLFDARRVEGDRALWEATAPFEGLLDVPAIERDLLGALLNLESRKFETVGPEADLARYGLAEPRYRVTIEKDRDGERTFELLVGGDVPDEEGLVWVKIADRAVVYATPAPELMLQMEKDSTLRRDANLTRLGYAALGRIEIEWEGGTTALGKTTGGWEIRQPDRRAADATKVEAWLDEVRGLTAQAFLDGPDKEALGLDSPRGRVSFFGPTAGGDAHAHDHGEKPGGEEPEGEEHEEAAKPLVVLLVGASAEEGGVYAMREDEPRTAFRAAERLVDLVDGGHFAFLPSEVFPAAPSGEAVSGIERTVGGASVTATKSGGGWSSPALDPIAISAVTSRLLGLRAIRWEGPADVGEGADPYGFASPRLTLHVRFQEGGGGEAEGEDSKSDAVYGVIVGKETERGFYARPIRRGTPGEGVFAISIPDFEALSGPLHRRVVTGTPGSREAVSAAITAGEESRSFSADEETGESLLALLDRLLSMTVVSAAPEGATFEEPPALVVAMEFRTRSAEGEGRRKFALEIGPETEGGRLARMRREGEPDEALWVIGAEDVDAIRAFLAE